MSRNPLLRQLLLLHRFRRSRLHQNRSGKLQRPRRLRRLKRSQWHHRPHQFLRHRQRHQQVRKWARKSASFNCRRKLRPKLARRSAPLICHRGQANSLRRRAAPRADFNGLDNRKVFSNAGHSKDFNAAGSKDSSADLDSFSRTAARNREDFSAAGRRVAATRLGQQDQRRIVL